MGRVINGVSVSTEEFEAAIASGLIDQDGREIVAEQAAPVAEEAAPDEDTAGEAEVVEDGVEVEADSIGGGDAG